MVVESPEVLYSVEGDDWPLVVLPAAGAVVLEEPEGPRVLQEEIEVSDFCSSTKWYRRSTLRILCSTLNIFMRGR